MHLYILLISCIISFTSSAPINVTPVFLTVCSVTSLIVNSLILPPFLTARHSNDIQTQDPQIRLPNWNQLTSFDNNELSIFASKTALTYRPESLQTTHTGSIKEDCIRTSIEHPTSTLPNIGFIDFNLDKKQVLIVLRGTLSLNEALIDLDVGQKEFKECKDQVHSGFLKMAQRMYPRIAEKIVSHFNDPENLIDQEIIFSGHSLGAGLSQLLSIMFYNDPRFPFKKHGGWNNSLNQFKVLAFSSPKVFRSIEKFPLGDFNLLRVIHQWDPVTHFWFGFKHLGKQVTIDRFDDVVFDIVKSERLLPWFRWIGQNNFAKWISLQLYHSMGAIANQMKIDGLKKID